MKKPPVRVELAVNYSRSRDIEVRHCLALQPLCLEAFRCKHDDLRRVLSLRGSKSIQKGQQEESSVVSPSTSTVASKRIGENYTGR